jgi:hypothetical protein
MREVRTDEGLRRLFPQGADVSAQPVAGLSGPASEAPPPGIGAELWAQISLCLDRVGGAARDLAAAVERDRLGWEDCHPIDIDPVAIASAGSMTDERWQPRKGWAWQVLLLTVVFGAGGTSGSLYKSADGSGALANNALHDFIPDTIGWASWEPKGLILLPGQQLLLTSAGGGATMRGQAVEIALHRLPDYLM